MAEVYLASVRISIDPDFLDLAEINLRKFRHDFSQDEHVVQAEKMYANAGDLRFASV
jgi:hypothetical protein